LAAQAGLVPDDIKVAFKATGLADLDELNRQLQNITDYEKATGHRLSGQRTEINAKLQQTMELIANQTIPVRVMNPGDIRPGSTSSASQGFASWGTGRSAPISAARRMPVRMVSV
jgi:hypothetical protein